MSQEPPPSKKHKTSKAGDERGQSLLLKEVEEKPRLPLMDGDEVEPTSHLEGAKEMNSEELEMLEELPSLPFVNKYRIGKYYYKRECYDEYYTLVKRMLDEEEECVTVTGTPGKAHAGGIGKSVFYGYFFQRFRKEMKQMERNDTWFIVATYNGRKLNAAFGYKDNDGNGVRLRKEDRIDDFLEEADQEKKKVLILCDGAPKRIRGGAQTVVFTSPNEGWMKMVRKDGCILYMPLWTLAELQMAARKLALHRTDGDRSYITGEIIEERFYTFGGECFLLTEDEISTIRQQLMTEIVTISDPSLLGDLTIGQQNRTICHRVLHLVPMSGEKKIKMATTQLASPFVKKILAERLATKPRADRERLRKCLDGLPEGAAISGWLFEIDVHETLGRGCTLKLLPLPSTESTPGNCNRALDASTAERLEELKIEEGEIDVFMLENLSALTATLGPYHKPESK